MGKLQEFLSTLTDLGARPQGSMQVGDFTLDRIRTLLATIGNPQQKYPSIHVGGTNGKGSVCAFCAAALQEQSYRVGTFTSPHVLGALHGIQVNGIIAGEGDLESAFEVLEPHLAGIEGWTQFEIVTALAFVHFARANVDVAVVEVGLGGRLDATNVITPTMSVITSIDYDHTSILGKTLKEIATEKAGIIKTGFPVVVALQPDEARGAILAVAEAKNSLVIEVGKDVLFERIHSDLNGQKLNIWPTGFPEEKQTLEIAMLGTYQIENAATAFAALRIANQHGLSIEQGAIRRGFASARWPGRFEVLQSDPPLILDAAHSPGAAKALRASLDEYFPSKKIITVLGVSADKDLEGLLQPLLDRLGTVIVTQSPHPRAMPAAKLADLLGELGVSATPEPNPAKALKTAMATGAANSLVLVAGSVFLVEAIRDVYFNRK